MSESAPVPRNDNEALQPTTWVGGPESATGGYIELDADGHEIDIVFPDEFEG